MKAPNIPSAKARIHFMVLGLCIALLLVDILPDILYIHSRRESELISTDLLRTYFKNPNFRLITFPRCCLAMTLKEEEIEVHH
jgi:hypothetical protein